VCPEKEEVIRDTGGVMYGGGADTVCSTVILSCQSFVLIVMQTVLSLHTFFLAMVLFPEAQRKAQKELDEVIGSTRLPDFEDRVNLPYINALCKEVMRWHPIIPLGVAHSVTQDNVLGNYFIPAGSLVLGLAC
jgi:Cytochrome P450